MTPTEYLQSILYLAQTAPIGELDENEIEHLKQNMQAIFELAQDALIYIDS